MIGIILIITALSFFNGQNFEKSKISHTQKETKCKSTKN